MFIFPIRHKSDTYDTLTKFIIRAERQLDLKVKTISSDIGGEFITSILTGFFVNRGIKHKKTNNYTPQQNGASERLNRTKPQQSSSGAVLLPPGLKFSDHEVVENGDDDEIVNNSQSPCHKIQIQKLMMI
ncbi:hypothetical protein TNCT_67381 [Trichonephila clavata]|uniref:Integrase catalytic domain-containing protein n=1 Tax=Trichonephila clavata TaxID=2740835 RepID=A0A8X6LRP1_TRICU|nr:hypothetical protein TNCT_154991 [Trichonephila clavata]GFR18162.1 hypothetical protein TNCT_67381 [Trichonephila clavata]